MAADGRLPGSQVFTLAVAACLLGDLAWYGAGRIFGNRVMKFLCRVSLTPDSCVNQTQSSFERWGSGVLIVAKFVPGLALVAPPLAGATRMGAVRFALYSALGGMLWVGAAMFGGLLLKPQIDRLLPRLAGLGSTLVVLILVALAAWILWKWWERRRFNRALDMARISVGELHEDLGAAAPPVILDVRSGTAQSLERRRIPGAVHVPLAEVGTHLARLPRDRDIILYCACPNEASAAKAAKLLMAHGFTRVRPLRGGLDAWIAAGYDVEQVATGAPPSPPASRAAA
ncbi:MAG: DedA family protein/thiosulfate sulfurtransferase GlpE [Proteobacteria bacterium]|nr:DedA family protein/thiosulfate sulfurtransferase GlpE [Pseudomonadota bacterium]